MLGGPELHVPVPRRLHRILRMITIRVSSMSPAQPPPPPRTLHQLRGEPEKRILYLLFMAGSRRSSQG